MKVLFMGTPEFAVPSLEALILSKHELVGVVTQPDRAVKRGRIEPCAVKRRAVEAGLTVLQPEHIRDAAGEISALGADIAVTAAYGQILTQSVLDAFKYGVINVHASLLPKYRGASPIYSAIINGDEVSGVTIMQTELGLDTGDILKVGEASIAGLTATEATDKLAKIGAKLLIETLDGYDKITPVKQDDSAATVCKTVKKHQQYLDFSMSASRVAAAVRALADEPGAKTLIDGEVYKIYRAFETENNFKPNAEAGEIVCATGRLVIACGVGALEVAVIQAPGKRALDAKSFLNGRKLPLGVVCGK